MTFFLYIGKKLINCIFSYELRYHIPNFLENIYISNKFWENETYGSHLYNTDKSQKISSRSEFLKIIDLQLIDKKKSLRKFV